MKSKAAKQSPSPMSTPGKADRRERLNTDELLFKAHFEKKIKMVLYSHNRSVRGV
jgi:hypothetical protein